MTNQFFFTFEHVHRNCPRKAAKLRGMYIFREENGDFLATWLSSGFGLLETGLDSPFVLQFASCFKYHITYDIAFSIWWFPEIVVPPNHPLIVGFSTINQPSWGTQLFRKHPYHFIFSVPLFCIFEVQVAPWNMTQVPSTSGVNSHVSRHQHWFGLQEDPR